jgi:hypothetical protein
MASPLAAEAPSLNKAALCTETLSARRRLPEEEEPQDRIPTFELLMPAHNQVLQGQKQVFPTIGEYAFLDNSCKGVAFFAVLAGLEWWSHILACFLPINLYCKRCTIPYTIPW